MSPILMYIFSSILTAKLANTEHIALIQSYFNVKKINYATIFTCDKQTEQVNLAKIFIKNTQILSISGMEIVDLNFLKTSHNHIGIVFNSDCSNSNSVLKECGELKFFDVKHHWLIISTSSNIAATFHNVTLNINADIHVAVLNQTIWKIFDLYNPASEHGGALNLVEIGSFSEEHGYRFKNEAKYFARRNMSGVSFKSQVVLPTDFNESLTDYLNSDSNRIINTFNRFHARLTSFCQFYYNYDVKMEAVKSWGYLKPDGTFDGMVGALQHKQVDFGSSPLFLRTDRAKFIDYGRNTWILRAAFLFQNPIAHTSIEIFLYPLPTSAWIITGLLALVAILILKSVTTFEKKNYNKNTETSWGNLVLVTLGALCQQGAPSTPYLACGRITTISIFLLSVLIYQFYSASLVSHLLMKPITNIRNLQELLDSDLKAGCEDILYDTDYFKHTTDKLALKILHQKILQKGNSSNFLTPEVGLKLVEAGNYAFHVETATAYPLIESSFSEKTICELREIQLFKIQPMHANYQKDSPFREMFDVCYQRLAEYGILYRERKHWHPRKPECVQSSKSVIFNVGLDQFYPALLILLIGIVISLGILVLEKQLKVVKKNKSRGNKMVLTQFYPFAFIVRPTCRN